MYAIAVFKSRKECMDFNSRMCGAGISGKIINTPRCIMKSCCLSVKFPIYNVDIAKCIISKNRYLTFEGLFKETESGAIKINT